MPRATRRVANRSGGSKASRKANRSADSLSDSLTLSTLRARVRAEAAASAGAATASKAVGGSNATSSPKDGSRTGVGEKGPPTGSAREAELLASEESEPSPTLGDISLPEKTGSAGSEDHFVSSVIDSCEEDGWDRLPSIEESSFYARRALTPRLGDATRGLGVPKQSVSSSAPPGAEFRHLVAPTVPVSSVARTAASHAGGAVVPVLGATPKAAPLAGVARVATPVQDSSRVGALGSTLPARVGAAAVPAAETSAFAAGVATGGFATPPTRVRRLGELAVSRERDLKHTEEVLRDNSSFGGDEVAECFSDKGHGGTARRW